MSTDAPAPVGEDNKSRYTVYLIIVAVAGWALASYDSNLLVLTLPDIKKDLHLTDGSVGLLGFIVYGAEFVITLSSDTPRINVAARSCGCSAWQWPLSSRA